MQPTRWPLLHGPMDAGAVFLRALVCPLLRQACRLWLWMLALGLAGWVDARPPQTEAEGLAVGDWVFRSGTGRESAWIRQASHSQWSHIGVVVAVSPHVQIAHATTNDHPDRLNQVVLSHYAEFSAPALAAKIAVARPVFLAPHERQTVAQAVAAQVGQAFVLTARDQQPRYCTTIVFDALQALRPGLPVRWQRQNTPLFAGEYLYPQALADLPGLQWLEAPSPHQAP